MTIMTNVYSEEPITNQTRDMYCDGVSPNELMEEMLFISKTSTRKEERSSHAVRNNAKGGKYNNDGSVPCVDKSVHSENIY